jgi:O-antigen/teichoic acid export membrane protein
MTVFVAAGFQVGAAGIAFFISSMQLRQRMPQPVKQAAARYQFSIWVKSGLSLVFLSGIDIINARIDSIMVGLLSDAESVGIYVVSARVAELIIFVLIAGGTAMAPKMASLHAAGELEKLQELLTRMSRLMFLLALPIALSFLTLGYWILYIFGPEFTQGLLCIRILSVARLIHVAFGPVNLLLIMCGQERDATKAIVAGTLINFVLNLILIPKWGIEGAALATGASIIVMSSLLTFTAYKKLGIYSSAAGRLILVKKRTDILK